MRRGFVAPHEILAPTELRLRATVELDGYADLHLLPAATGEVRVTGVPRSEVVGGTMVDLNRFWTGAPSLRLIPRGEPPAEPPPLLLAGVAVGLTVDDGLVRGRARVRVEARLRSSVWSTIGGPRWSSGTLAGEPWRAWPAPWWCAGRTPTASP